MIPKDRNAAGEMPPIRWRNAFRDYTPGLWVYGWGLQKGAGGVHGCRRRTRSWGNSRKRGRFSERNVPMYLAPAVLGEMESLHRDGLMLMAKL